MVLPFKGGKTSNDTKVSFASAKCCDIVMCTLCKLAANVIDIEYQTILLGFKITSIDLG